MLLIGMNVSFATEVTMNLNVRFTGSILQDASVQLSVGLFFKPSHVFLDDARSLPLCSVH